MLKPFQQYHDNLASAGLCYAAPERRIRFAIARCAAAVLILAGVVLAVSGHVL